MMESSNNKRLSDNDNIPEKEDTSFIVTKLNWEIDNNKNLDECISTFSLSQAPERTNLEDVVSLDTCVALKPDPTGELCKLEFKVTNKQKIARIAVVSEASVLEFFKQSGEYATTSFAEFVDEFQDHAVYFAETNIHPASSEATINFTRIKNKGKVMWIYGIKLILTEPATENSSCMFDLDVINNFLSNDNQIKPDKAEMARKLLEPLTINVENNFMGEDMNTYLRKISMMNWNSQKIDRTDRSSKVHPFNNTHKNTEYNINCDSSQDLAELKSYIDNKFVDLEKRLMERIEIMDKNINSKLDAILKNFELKIKE